MPVISSQFIVGVLSGEDANSNNLETQQRRDRQECLSYNDPRKIRGYYFFALAFSAPPSLEL